MVGRNLLGVKGGINYIVPTKPNEKGYNLKKS